MIKLTLVFFLGGLSVLGAICAIQDYYERIYAWQVPATVSFCCLILFLVILTCFTP